MLTRHRAMLVTSVVLCAVASPDFARAQEPTIDELHREIRALRSELVALRLALSQMAELDRQRANLLTRALSDVPSSAPAAPPRAAPGLADRTAPPNKGKAAPVATPAPVIPAPALVAVPDPLPPIAAPVAEPPRARPAGGSGTITGRVQVPSGEPVAYVYVENIRSSVGKSQTVTMEQLRKQFTPRWAVIKRGTTIQFPNLDNVYHNVFSRSAGNSFDLGLYGGADGAKSHTFVTAGVVDIYCNIHPQMSARVLVVPNDYFAKVQPDGTFVLPNVPGGRRKIVAWAPGSEVSSAWVELDGQASVELALQSRAEGHLNKQGRPYGSYE